MTDSSLPAFPFLCTSLRTKDTQGNSYHGRTLEFSTEAIASYTCFIPKGLDVEHTAPDGSTGLSYTSLYDVIGIGFEMPGSGKGLDYELVEGVNEKGLSFSLNMMTNSTISTIDKTKYAHALSLDSVGNWILSNFSDVAQIKQALEKVTVFTRAIPQLMGVESPFHFVVYDTSGGCIVLEAQNGVLYCYDNPSGVLTNGPAFPWHLTNMNNYTHLSNIDVSHSEMWGVKLQQPDSGIATASLPSSDTSVDRFVRAVFYSHFSLQSDTAQGAVIELSHVMNKFDRPKNITVSSSGATPGMPNKVISEFTLWTTLTDLANKTIYIRGYHDLNYMTLKLSDFSTQKSPVYTLLK